MLLLPFRPKLFKGWTNSWYFDTDEDDNPDVSNPDDGGDENPDTETEPGPQEGGDGDDGDGDEPDPTKADASSEEELLAALADPDVEVVTLTANIQNTDNGILLTEGEKTINLNGYSITGKCNDTETECSAIRADGEGTKLTITGDGAVYGGDGSYADVAVWANNGAEITIESGDYDDGFDMVDGANNTIYASNGSTIIIKGGTFKNSSVEGVIGPKAYVLNIQNKSGSYIYCYGGTYYNQNPADGDDSDTTTGATFLADGCTVTETSEGVYVVS